MLTEQGCRERRERLWQILPAEAEWVLLADPRHVLYFSGFWVNPCSFSAGERAIALLARDGSSELIADNFTWRSRAADPFVDRESLVSWYDHQHSVTPRASLLIEATRSALARFRGQGAFEAEWMPAALAAEADQRTLNSFDLTHAILQLRRRKLPDEVSLIEHCCRATEAGHQRALEFVRPGVSELDVYRELQSAAIEALGQPAVIYGDFRPTNASRPKAGGLPTTELLEDGDLLILDYSVVCCGYRSDFTNTIAVGRPSQSQQAIFAACEQALQTGAALLRPAASCADIARSVSQCLEQSGHGPLRHHAGHGIGLGHPEPPILGPHSSDQLQVGDIVTVEPGLYIEGVGGVRLEHNFLIETDGARQLSQHRLALVAD